MAQALSPSSCAARQEPSAEFMPSANWINCERSARWRIRKCRQVDKETSRQGKNGTRNT
jgi:hypothetical protein